MAKLSIIIPAYNEVRTITEIVRTIQQIDLEKELIIVDDGSTDGTTNIIKSLKGSNIKKLFHEVNRGKGAAVRSGLQHVDGDIVIIQDADLEYPPQNYHRLISSIVEDKADVVFGSRFMDEHRCFLFSHYIGNKIVNFMANILYDTTLTDMMSGHKAFKQSIFNDIHLSANGFGFEAEITGELFKPKRKLRVYEVPITYFGRTYEEGKKITWVHFFEIIYWLIKTKLKP